VDSSEPGSARVGESIGGVGDASLLRFVADLYFVREWTEARIAKLLGCSRSKVSRLLSAARAQGIVRVTLVPEPKILEPLARELASAIGIAVGITAGQAADSAASGRICAVAAAPMIADELPTEGIIGVAGGYTVSTLVESLPRVSRPGLIVVPIVGSYYVHDSNLDVNAVASSLARALGASAQRILAPGLLDSLDTKMALLQDSTVRVTTALWTRLDFVLVGVSGPPHDRPGYPTVMDQLDAAGRRRLAAKGVVGEVAGHLLARDGSIVEDEWTSRALSIPFDLLRSFPRVVGVSAGVAKVDGIAAAVRSGVLKRLITDEPTARAILRLGS
jgi:deoxyribonucleoside regulator